MDKTAQMAALRAEIGDCIRCGLCEGRTQIVFGTGDLSAKLMFIGEAPGFDEDRQGEPFVGAAGQLLNKMIAAMGLRREEVYIANIIKCRPPNNRDPFPDEMDTCKPFLLKQVEIIQPKVICTLGRFSAQNLLGVTTSITRLRGKWYRYQDIPLMPTFHPAYLLRNPQDKKLVWHDMQMIMAELKKYQ